MTDATMTHGEAWHFCRLGRMLERADKTSRILDVKYFILLRSVADVGTIYDDVQWVAVLRSASAFEMYRKRHGRISPIAIVEFLLLDGEFPRAVRFCLNSARDSFHAISGAPVGTESQAGRKTAGPDLFRPGPCQRGGDRQRRPARIRGCVADEREPGQHRHLRTIFRHARAENPAAGGKGKECNTTMAIHVALHHKTHYTYDRPVAHLPHTVRLRPGAPLPHAAS